MTGPVDHLVIAPIILPMLAGAGMILAGERRRGAAVALGLASTLLLVALSAGLLVLAAAPDVRIYRLGDWPAAFGIVLVLDRLSALMLALSFVLGLAAFVFSLARWHRAGAFFHPLLQFQIMGLNGAFLAGDLFNLFVFFEVTLAASYGLALHGSGRARVVAGLHYVVVNLLTSLLFLIGVSVVYGIAGTLNMADLAARVRSVAAEDRALLEAGLIAPKGQKEVPGRPTLWGTTSRFLEQFGLGSLRDLPKREELVSAEAAAPLLSALREPAAEAMEAEAPGEDRPGPDA